MYVIGIHLVYTEYIFLKDKVFEYITLWVLYVSVAF